MPADIAAGRMAKIKAAGIEKIMFAWSGSTDKGQQYQYQVQGPTFLIEHQNTQNNGNHIHASGVTTTATSDATSSPSTWRRYRIDRRLTAYHRRPRALVRNATSGATRSQAAT
jgi:Protein of unknown function (DUF3500)